MSLKKSNKRYHISKENMIIRVTDYLKNIWMGRRYFIEAFGITQIINGNQIPLHRNESSEQFTLNFNNSDTFAKENDHLLWEQITVFTQVASDQAIKIPPEFVFKDSADK